MFTKNELAHRDGNGWSRDSAWEGSAINSRIYNDNAATPYLDDTYRADNRYGPKPVYDDNYKVPDGTPVGTAISSNAALTDIDTANGLYGLDGYWERRAIGQGLRILVGQRLELGNAFGWQGAYQSAAGLRDPLYPVDNNNNSSSATQTRQRRTLYDNLAAVQGMVVYHYESGSHGALPLACIASTAHPGTVTTLKNSRTFNNYAATGVIETDFLTGRGTNGWEFDFHSGFATKMATDTPLKLALKNLAYFAGDSAGGAPSYIPVQDSFPHPYPYQAMWGDFSNLRRVVDSGTAYTSLSPADQSTLQSAACTLGLLSYDLTKLEAEAKKIIENHLAQIGPVLDNPANSTTIASVSSIVGRVQKLDELASDVISDDEKPIIARYLQVERDRRVGFLQDSALAPAARICTLDDFDGIGLSPARKNNLYNALCLKTSAQTSKYPSLYYIFPEFDHHQLGDNDIASVGILLNHTQPSAEEYISQTNTTPGYSTEYLASSSDASVGINRASEVTYKVVGDNNNNNLEDAGEAGVSSIALAPRAIADWKLPTSSVAGPSLDTESMQILVGSSLKEVSLLDKAMFDGREHMSIRVLDFDVDKLSTVANTNPDGSDQWIPKVDGIVYAYREDAVREDAIVRPKDSTTSWTDCDTWAEVYTNGSGAPYGVTTPSGQRNCRLKKTATFPFLQDPPLMDGSKISTKPIDFYPDPERRPYGFRLVNGSTLHRANAVQSGMTFISDNLVYIKGDFNIHTASSFNPTITDACTSFIEEFTQRLIGNDCTKTATYYYDGRTTSNGNFANPDVPSPDTASSDKWRPVEIIGDAVGVLSRTFNDGNIEDAFTLARKPANEIGYGLSSYQNQNRLKIMQVSGASSNPLPVAPYYNSSDWRHTDTADTTTPILINRNGGAIKPSTSSVPDGFALSNGDKVVTPSQYLSFATSDNNFPARRRG